MPRTHTGNMANTLMLHCRIIALLQVTVLFAPRPQVEHAPPATKLRDPAVVPPRPLEEASPPATKAGEVAPVNEIGSCRGTGKGCGHEDEDQHVLRVIVKVEVYVTRTRSITTAVPR